MYIPKARAHKKSLERSTLEKIGELSLNKSQLGVVKLSCPNKQD